MCAIWTSTCACVLLNTRHTSFLRFILDSSLRWNMRINKKKILLWKSLYSILSLWVEVRYWNIGVLSENLNMGLVSRWTKKCGLQQNKSFLALFKFTFFLILHFVFEVHTLFWLTLSIWWKRFISFSWFSDFFFNFDSKRFKRGKNGQFQMRVYNKFRKNFKTSIKTSKNLEKNQNSQEIWRKILKITKNHKSSKRNWEMRSYSNWFS